MAHLIPPTTRPPSLEVFAPGDLTLLHRIYTGQFGFGRGVLYSEPGRRNPTQRQLRSLASLGVVKFYDARAGGWEPGMWGCRLICVGANVVFRHDGKPGRDSHPGCAGYWNPDGTCTDCRSHRPLDDEAYTAYLEALHATDPAKYDRQVCGPQLYCVEHGWMRFADLTTTKVCRLPGTEFHDGGLLRMTPEDQNAE